MFNRSFNVPGKFQESFHGRFKCFIDVLYCNFVFAWHSSQLPEQKEGLFLNAQKNAFGVGQLDNTFLGYSIQN